MCKGGDSVARRNWTREETILAMDLYTRVPFSKIGKNNQEIINLASIINRTPDAVAYKMSNLAHYDPELQARNVSGLSAVLCQGAACRALRDRTVVGNGQQNERTGAD